MLLTRCCNLIGQPNIPSSDTKTYRECPDVFFRVDSPAHLSYAHACTKEKYGWPARLVLPLELSSLSLQSRVAVSVRYIQVPLACFRAVVSVASTYCVAHVDGSSLPRLCARIIVHKTHVCAEGFAL